MVTILRFKGHKALPVLNDTERQRKRFFNKAIELVNNGPYWHMNMLDEPDEETPFDQSENDTKLTLEINHYHSAFAAGLTGKERMILYLETLRDSSNTIEEFDEVDDNGYGGIRRYISVSTNIIAPSLNQN